MSELERMRRGELYDFSSPEIMESVRRKRRALDRLNATAPGDADYAAALQALIPEADPSATVIPPFFCDHGHPIRLGAHSFVNAGCTFLDSGGITIGAHTLIGPGCHLCTPQHPMDHLERRYPVERALAIAIGDDCWLGANVTVCPGVTIGDRSVIGAGSVVTRDIPADSLAAGNPATVKRKLNE